MLGKMLMRSVTRDLTGGLVGGLGRAAAFGAGAALSPLGGFSRRGESLLAG